MKKFFNYLGKVLYYLLIIFMLWIVFSSMIQRFKCPNMTETEIFLHIPKSVICDWEKCDH